MITFRRCLSFRSPLFLFAVLFIAAVHLAGCVGAYVTFPANDLAPAPQLPATNLSLLKISYTPFDGTFKNDYAMSLERTLRKRFQILDIKQISKSAPDAPDRFIIQPEQKFDYSALSMIWFGVNFLSIGTIPAVSTQTDHVELTIIAPGGDDKKTFQYSYKERFYSWVPLLFFNPDYAFVLISGGENYEDDRAKAIDAIVTQFMIDATPFIQSHTAQ